MKMNICKLTKYTIIIAVIIAIVIITYSKYRPYAKPIMYPEIRYFTPNFDSTAVNELQGVILHHTAEPTVEKALNILSLPENKVGAHVVIDTDGTRYIMAATNAVTYHAGLSILNNRESCNYFTIGIEFQGNTLVAPLTKDQIASGVEYLLPIIEKYNISLENIVTHEMVRTAYKQKYPTQYCSGKVDITQTEYIKFMRALREEINHVVDPNKRAL